MRQERLSSKPSSANSIKNIHKAIQTKHPTEQVSQHIPAHVYKLTEQLSPLQWSRIWPSSDQLGTLLGPAGDYLSVERHVTSAICNESIKTGKRNNSHGCE